MNIKVSIIGGEGFIGKYLCKRLKDEGFNVKSFDIKTGFDVKNENQVNEAIKGSEIIFNLASIAGVDNVEKNPIECIETNIIGNRNILKHKKGKLIYFSTSEVYGKNADYNVEDEVLLIEPPGHSRWGYQTSKICAEHLIMISNPNSLIIRPFNIFGIGQSLNGAIAKFVHWAVKNEDVLIYGDGLQIRSWIGIDDFVDGVLTVMNKSGIYNIGGTYIYSTLELAKLIIKWTKSHSKIVFLPPKTDVQYRVANISKITNETGWIPKKFFKNEIIKYAKSINHSTNLE